MSEEYYFTIGKEESGQRLDAFLAGMLKPENISRMLIQKLILSGGISVNGNLSKANYKMKNNDEISVEIPEPEDMTVEPENIPLDIVYQDKDIIIINKPRGMVVHPAPGNNTGTLVNALLYHCRDLSDINGVKRPGIVHRIDKDTTGLIAVAKNNQAHTGLSEQLAIHSMKRTYIAIVEGRLESKNGIIDAPIGRCPYDRKKMCVSTKNSKYAITHYHVLEHFEDATYVECELETGRTHQIRVHMAYIGHPVSGDPVYGKKNNRGMQGQALHAMKLKLVHPCTGELMEFTCEPPEDFRNLLNRCRS